jgi:hypothetical protein
VPGQSRALQWRGVTGGVWIKCARVVSRDGGEKGGRVEYGLLEIVVLVILVDLGGGRPLAFLPQSHAFSEACELICSSRGTPSSSRKERRRWSSGEGERKFALLPPIPKDRGQWGESREEFLSTRLA